VSEIGYDERGVEDMEERPIPAQLRYYAELRYGAEGRTWLAELDERIDGLATNFGLEVAPPFDPGGSEAWTALAQRGDGSEAVLKVPISSHAARTEAAALLRWGGRGAVRLLELAPEGNALLVERCRPGRRLSEENFETQDEVTVEVFGALHVRLSGDDRRFPDLAEVLGNWAERSRQRYREFNTPCRADLLEDAARIMETVHREELLLHGDLHPENTLSAEREPWLAIDPIPMVGTPAFDAVQYLLFRGGALEDRVAEWPEHIWRFCRLVGVDRDELCRLAFAKLVHDGLWALELGESNWSEHLEVAELVRRLSL
jgi:streptomycin 6-kinase